MAAHWKEALIRECFEHERDIAFRQFRRLHVENPEVVRACPDPELREQMLRGFWNQDSEKHYPEFYKKTRGMSVESLLDLRADLIDRLDAIGCMEYREQLRAAAGQPRAANDNERRPER